MKRPISPEIRGAFINGLGKGGGAEMEVECITGLVVELKRAKKRKLVEFGGVLSGGLARTAYLTDEDVDLLLEILKESQHLNDEVISRLEELTEEHIELMASEYGTIKMTAREIKKRDKEIERRIGLYKEVRYDRP